MRKTFLLALFLFHCFVSVSQIKKRVSRSRLVKDHITALTIKAGDVLLYQANQHGIDYTITATVQEIGNNIRLNYSIPKRKKKGKLVIPSMALRNAVFYDPLLNQNNKNFKNTNIFWLSSKNYKELSSNEETIMDLGAGKEVFKRERVNTLKIKYKGIEKIIGVSVVANTALSDPKSFLVVNHEKYPLLIKIESGWTLTLKEVR